MWLRHLSSKPKRPLIGRYTDALPTALARVQSGANVKLRDYETQKKNKRTSYDLKLDNGLFKPAPGQDFIGPNGCSLRPPLSPTFQEVVRNFRGSDIRIYVLDKDVKLPPNLVVLHEHSDHYSLQATEEMPLKDLNEALTEFVHAHGKLYNKHGFVEEFPFEL